MASSEPAAGGRHAVVAFGVSSIGGRENNEDCSLILNLKSQKKNGGTHDGLDRGVLLVVSDGMGGARGGEVASGLAVESLHSTLHREWVQQGRSMLAELENDLNAAFNAANDAVKERVDSDSSTEGMGATLTAVVLLQNRLVLGHVGDSRCYISRGEHLKQISTDHTLVEDLIAQGKLTRDQAEHHPQKNLLSHAIGLEDELRPQLRSFSLRAGDRVLLCSDGLTDQVSDEVIAGVLSEFIDPELAARELVDRALASARAAEIEADNITVVVGRLRRIESRLGGKPSFEEKQTKERVRTAKEEIPTPGRVDRVLAGTVDDHSGVDGHEDAGESAGEDTAVVWPSGQGRRAMERGSPSSTEVARGVDGVAGRGVVEREVERESPAEESRSGARTAPVIESRGEDGVRQLSFVRLPDELARLPEAIDRGVLVIRAFRRTTERILFVVCGLLVVLLVIVALLLIRVS